MRSIHDPWEVTQDVPSPYMPVKFIVKNFVPFKTAEEFAAHINKFQPKSRHDYEHLNMPGRYVLAEMINGEVWVTFNPEKLGGKYWVSLPN